MEKPPSCCPNSSTRSSSSSYNLSMRSQQVFNLVAAVVVMEAGHGSSCKSLHLRDDVVNDSNCDIEYHDEEEGEDDLANGTER
jgi:hypothetical protein